jgi:hypothetical protein
LFRVVTVNHFACFTTTNSHLLPLSLTRAQVKTKRNKLENKTKLENGNGKTQLRRNEDAPTIIIVSKKRRRNETKCSVARKRSVNFFLAPTVLITSLYIFCDRRETHD